MIDLLLVRHGEAVDAGPGMTDGERFLTARGRRRTRRVGAALAKALGKGPGVGLMLTSALVRATQTAEVLAGSLGMEGGVEVLRPLAVSDVGAVLARVVGWRGPGVIALVGHEPGLSEVAVQVLGAGVAWPGMVKSGAVMLGWEPGVGGRRGTGEFRWAIGPKTDGPVTRLDALWG